MSKRNTILALGFAAFAALPGAAQADYFEIAYSVSCPLNNVPGPSEVLVFTSKNFTGNCASLGLGLYPSSYYMGQNQGVANDSIHSMKIGTKVRVALFSDDRYGGYLVEYKTGDVNFDNGYISSMRVEPLR